MPRRRRNQTPFHDCDHAVKFYADTNSLFRTVAAFLGQGFVDAHPTVIIATPDHVMGIMEHMRQATVDVEQARRAGTLVVLDADKTLASFMVGDTPDPDRFEQNVGQLIRDLVTVRTRKSVRTGQSPIRVYGEMVDVLWKEGRADAAIRLEMLWNGLASRFGFALLCGYAMGNFYKQTHLLEEVCRQHTHVMTPDVPTQVRPS
jgi:hypothetical protein